MAFKQQAFIPHRSGGWRSEVSLQGGQAWRRVSFCIVDHWLLLLSQLVGREDANSLASSYKGVNLIPGGSIMTSQRPHVQKSSHWRLGFNVWIPKWHRHSVHNSHCAKHYIRVFHSTPQGPKEAYCFDLRERGTKLICGVKGWVFQTTLPNSFWVAVGRWPPAISQFRDWALPPSSTPPPTVPSDGRWMQKCKDLVISAAEVES